MPDDHDRRRLFVCEAADVAAGGRVVRRVGGREVGIFNVDGNLYALHNRCPHAGGALCRGPVTGTTSPTPDFRHAYEREGKILRCAWHGWEFELETGRSLVDPHVRARTYPVEVEDGKVYVLV